MPYHVRARSGTGAFGVVVESARDALAKASQLIEDGHESITFRDLAGNVIDQAAMNAFAKKEKRGLGRWRCFPKWKLYLAKRR